jgi:hypothetical protein
MTKGQAIAAALAKIPRTDSLRRELRDESEILAKNCSMSGFVGLDTLQKGRFMQKQRLICGWEVLPSGEERTVVKVAEVTPEQRIRIVYEFWRTTQSEYHNRPTGIVDLGEID